MDEAEFMLLHIPTCPECRYSQAKLRDGEVLVRCHCTPDPQSWTPLPRWKVRIQQMGGRVDLHDAN